MRILLTLLALPLVTHARVCGPTSAEVDVEAKAPLGAVVAPAILPTHGGQIVYADSVPMEVVVKGDGSVQAFPVVTVAGQPPALAANARVSVNVPVQNGPAREVHLAWNGPNAVYSGRVRGAVVAPGPLNVVVVDDGRRYESIAPLYVTPVVVASGPQVVVQRPSAAVVVQQPSAAVYVQRPSAAVYVGGPAVDVRVNAPSIAVVPPAPRVTVVGGVYVDDGYRHHDNGKHRGWYDDGRGPPGHGGHHGHGRH